MNEMTRRYEFKRRFIGVLDFWIFIEPLFYCILGIVLTWKFGMKYVFVFDGRYEIIFALFMISIFIAYSLWVFLKPAVVVENGTLSICKPFRHKLIPVASIVKADIDQSFYIYFTQIDGKEDGCYLPVRKESFSKLSELIFNKCGEKSG